MKENIRSMLFVPANKPKMVKKAALLDADVVILDLEDAVCYEEKQTARDFTAGLNGEVDIENKRLVIRINSFATDFGYEDIKDTAEINPYAYMIPKSSEEDMIRADKLLTEIERALGLPAYGIKLYALVETAYGVERVFDIINTSERVDGVLFGAEDFTRDMEIERTVDGEELLYARNRIALACRACNVGSIDTPFLNITDEDGLMKEIERVKLLGMTGKAAIHPRQVGVINRMFMPSDSEIERAQRIVEGSAVKENGSRGVFVLDGKMVDAPVVERAKNVLRRAGCYR